MQNDKGITKQQPVFSLRSRYFFITCSIRRAVRSRDSMISRKGGWMRVAFTLALLMLGLALCTPAHLSAQQQDLAFERFTTEDGLTSDVVSVIIQDRMGFLWMGTYSGLLKYDGYTFTSYKADPVDPHRLKDRHISALLEDHAGNIWIGTGRGGLSRFDRETERFTQYQHDPDDPNSLSSTWVSSIVEDEPGVLWIATLGGLDRLDTRTGRFTHYRHDPDNPNSLSSDSLLYLYKDRNGTFWIGSTVGLDRFDREQGSFTRFQHDANNPLSLSSGSVSAIIEDKAGRLWIGLGGGHRAREHGGGLDLFDRETGAFTHFRHDHADSSLSSYRISALYEDRGGNLWIGNWGTGGGLDRMDSASGHVIRYQYDPADPASLPQNWGIMSILEDRSGMLWIGTGGGYVSKVNHSRTQFRRYAYDEALSAGPGGVTGVTVVAASRMDSAFVWIGTTSGLMQFDRSTGRLVRYSQEAPNSDSPLDHSVNALYEDSGGVLWIGTEAGLYRLDLRSRRLTSYRSGTDRTQSLCSDQVTSIMEDHQGMLWIGSYDENYGGITRLDRQSGSIRCYRQDPDAAKVFNPRYVIVVYEAPSEPGVLWFGSQGGGLNRFDTKTGRFTSYFDPYNISSVHSIYEDRTGRLWVGTFADGLHLFDRQTGKSTRYDEQDGLANDLVMGILEDAQGRLWLSTHKGLSRLDPGTGAFKNFGAEDGVQDLRFNRGAALRTSDGALFFGGTTGLTHFFPEHLEANPHPPQVALTGFRLFEEPVVPGPNAPLRRHISNAEEVVLNHRQNDLSFDFVGLHYGHPERNRYAYMLDSYDETWREVGTQRTATYTNLSPGRYIFRVKAANEDGLWNEEGISLRVVILPPWWRTWWAYFFYGLLFCAGVFAVDRIQRRRLIRRERTRAERETEKLRAEAAEAWANYLQSENQRQTQELEQARALQLSMLPERVPEHPVVEIAAYMKTATEVGGDYYDFVLSDDGTLTVIIGDATGHGVSAGTMVTATKGILNVLSGEEDLEQVLTTASEAVRRMHLPKLYMALALVRLRDHTLELAGAGMPPALVYRAASGCVEAVALNGMPLGGPGVYPYRRQCMLLSAGDTVVLMSDGFPELSGASGQRLGYDRMPGLVAEAAARSPEQVIDYLMETAKAWCNGQVVPDDDMTFVVLKVKA